jgi:hypothetical protein
MITWVAPSSTGDLRRWGALNNRRLSADTAGANAVGFGKKFSSRLCKPAGSSDARGPIHLSGTLIVP